MTEIQKENLLSLTGLTLEHIVLMTNGQFTLTVYKLYFKHVISEKQYKWLEAYRKLYRGGKIDVGEPIDQSTKDALEVFEGEMI